MHRMIIIPIMIILSIVLIYLIQQKKENDILPPNMIFSSGVVESKSVTVTSQTTGVVLEKFFKRGSYVQAGDTLLLIEREIFDTQMDELETTRKLTRAELEAAQIELKNARKKLNRTSEAYKTGSIAEAKYDDLKAAVDAGEKRISILNSKFDLLDVQSRKLQIQLDHTIVTAPIAGHVQSDPIAAGELVLPGSAIAEIVNLDDTWIEIFISEADISFISLNDEAEVYLDALPDEAQIGYVSFISQQAEFTPKNVQTKKERVKQVFVVHITIDNQDQLFKPGLPVDVYLEKDDHSSN